MPANMTISGLSSAPASRTRFTPNKHPRITVATRQSLRLPECIINEETQEDTDGGEGAQYATVRSNSPDGDTTNPSRSDLIIKSADQFRQPPATANPLMTEGDAAVKAERRKLIRSALAIGNPGGPNELALRAARRRVQNRAQSMYIPTTTQNPFGIDPNEMPNTPPASPPVFNFSAQRSPLPFSSAISPSPASSADGAFSLLQTLGQRRKLGLPEARGLPAQVLAQHQRSVLRGVSGPAGLAQRTHRGHRRAQSTDETSSTGGGQIPATSIPSLAQIREWAAAKKDQAGKEGGGLVVEVTKPVEETERSNSPSKDASDEESDKEKKSEERKSKRASLVILKRRSMGPGSPPDIPIGTQKVVESVVTVQQAPVATLISNGDHPPLTPTPTITLSTSTPPISPATPKEKEKVPVRSRPASLQYIGRLAGPLNNLQSLPSPRTFSTARSVSDSTRTLAAKNMLHRLSANRVAMAA